MQEKIPSTVIKLPLDVNENSVPSNRRIRLKNNIRLNLPSDQWSPLHSRPLCLLLALYLAYTMYLHYTLYTHIASAEARHSHCEEEKARVQRYISSLARVGSLNDLKQMLRTAMKYSQDTGENAGLDFFEPRENQKLRLIEKLHELSGLDVVVRVNQKTRPDKKFTIMKPGFSEELRQYQRLSQLGMNQESGESLLEAEGQYTLDSKRRTDLYWILQLEDKDQNRSQVVLGWNDPLSHVKPDDKVPNLSTETGDRSPEKKVIERSVETDSHDIDLVLPDFPPAIESEEKKPRRVRDVMSQSPSTGKGKTRGNRKKIKSRETRRQLLKPNDSKRSRKKCVSILLKGAAPMASIRDGGSIIRPWYIDARANGNAGSADVNRHFVLQELNGKVQIMRNGLYMVYAQIYYSTSEQIKSAADAINSYSVIVSSSPIAERPIAVCSVQASVNYTSEVSCHLSIVYHLSKGERVYLVQREPNRSILLKEGYSYFGISTLRIDD